MRTDRGNQLGGRDLIAHLALSPGFALVDVDQEQATGKETAAPDVRAIVGETEVMGLVA